MSKVVDGIVKDLKNIPESLRKKMKGTDKNKLIRMSIPYVIVGYFCDKSAWMFRQVEGDIFPRLMDTASRLGEAFANPLPSFNPMDLLFGVACGVWQRKMGKCKGYRALYGSGIREQYHLNSIGEAHDVGKTQFTQVCQE